MFFQQAVNSRDLDYSHFVSLPLAIHPELVDKLVNFQNTILGITASDKDKNLDSDTSGDTSDEEVVDQHSTASKVFVELKVEKTDADVKINVMSDLHSPETPVVTEVKAEDADTHVKVNVTDIPLVSYRPKESKAPVLDTSSSKLIGTEIYVLIEIYCLLLFVLTNPPPQKKQNRELALISKILYVFALWSGNYRNYITLLSSSSTYIRTISSSNSSSALIRSSFKCRVRN